MPISLVFTLTPEVAVTPPDHLGRAAHSLLLRLIAVRDPALAGRLHEGESGPRPFTCSSLIGMRHQEGGSAGAEPGGRYWLRFTGLSDEVAGFLSSLAQDSPAVAELDNIPFRVLEATIDPAAHPWAGEISYEELSAPWLLARNRADPRIEMEFVSPTSFRSGGMNIPFPLPDLVFGGLLDRWNAFAPVALNPEMRRFAAECVAVSRYRLRTRPLRFKQGSLQVGCTGRCVYVALNKDRYWLSILNLLADFAFYGGVGYQTTVGMGQARRVLEVGG
jgi:CRISPR-associated endoribonuclease Cas6